LVPFCETLPQVLTYFFQCSHYVSRESCFPIQLSQTTDSTHGQDKGNLCQKKSGRPSGAGKNSLTYKVAERIAQTNLVTNYATDVQSHRILTWLIRQDLERRT